MAIGDRNVDRAQPALLDEADDAARGPGFAARARSAMRAAFDMILPPLCLGCEARLTQHDALCPACWRGIAFIRPPLCDRLGLPLPFDTGGTMISAAAEADPPDYDRARAVAAFDGPMRDLIHDLKFRDTHDARRLFGRWLSEAGAELIADANLIVPVPLARLRLISRRFNQAQILAAELARQTGKPIDAFALRRTRATPHQIGLSRSERHRNVAGAFSIAPEALPSISGRSVLLIDDVITTGATASAAARALRKAGARQVDVLALALVTEPHA